MRNKRNLKEERGITLLALIITIIILVILALITINSAYMSGIIQFGVNGAKDYAKATIEENKIMEDTASMMSSAIVNIKEMTLGEMTRDDIPGELSGDGTEANPFLIESIEDLVAFSNNVNGGNSYEGQYIQLTINLNFEAAASYVDANNKELFKDYNDDGVEKGIQEELIDKEQRGFIAIGKAEASESTQRYRYEGNFFKGNFDGNNKIIKNMHIKSSTEDEVEFLGLFGGNTGKIKNLTVTGKINIYDESEEKITKLIGGIVAYNEGNIENCNNETIIEGTGEYNSYIRRGSRI